MRTDTTRNALIPISTVFASNISTYIASLTACRGEPTGKLNPSNGSWENSGLDNWIIGFAQAGIIAVGKAVQLAEKVSILGEQLRGQLIEHRAKQGRRPIVPRRNSFVLRVLEALPSNPVLTVESAAELTGVSPAAAHRGLTELSEAEVLGRTKDQKGPLLCWTADSYLMLIAQTENNLA